MSQQLRRFVACSVAFLVVGCAAQPKPVERPAMFELSIQDDAEARLFRVTLLSRDARPICVPVEEWPELGMAPAKASVRYGDKFYRSLGPTIERYCVGGCDDRRIESGSKLLAEIPYSSFAGEAEIAQLPTRDLVFHPPVRVCAYGGP